MESCYGKANGVKGIKDIGVQQVRAFYGKIIGERLIWLAVNQNKRKIRV